MSSSRQRKLDEKNQKILRDLAALPENKHCFDCHQRGPTYVNMTVGSFVCTGCSGILRGLNPPCRVKSISMATFTPEEIEFIKSRGNAVSKQIWLGLYDGSDAKLDAFRDDQHVKDFLAMKYEKKRWYVSPEEIARQKQLMDAAAQRAVGGTSSSPNASNSVSSNSSQPQTTNSGVATGSLIDAFSPEHKPKPVVTSAPSTNTNGELFRVNRPHGNAAQQAPLKLPGAPYKPPETHSTQTTNAPKSAVDLLSDNDLFAAPPPQQIQNGPAAPPAASSQSAGGFADFANFDAFSSSSAQPTAVAASMPPSQSHFGLPTNGTPLQPTVSSASVLPKSATMPVNMISASTSTPTGTTNTLVNGTAAAGGGDKYSALAELDELFKDEGNSNVSWGAPSLSSGPKVVSGAPVNWGGFGSGGTFGSPGSTGLYGRTAPPNAAPVPAVVTSAGTFGPASNPFFAGSSPSVLPPTGSSGPPPSVVPPALPSQPPKPPQNWPTPVQPNAAVAGAPTANPFGAAPANPFGLPGTLHSGSTPTPMNAGIAAPTGGWPGLAGQQPWNNPNANPFGATATATGFPSASGGGTQPANANWNPFLS